VPKAEHTPPTGGTQPAHAGAEVKANAPRVDVPTPDEFLVSDSIEINLAPQEPRPAEPPPAEPLIVEPLIVEPPFDYAAAHAEAEARATEHRDAWLRAKAETENLRRRAQEDVAKAAKFAAERFASAMLPVKDSLETALATENQTLEKLREGVELTLRQLVSAFDGASLVEENPLGQKFDPNKHQAISALPAEAEPNTVINVLQKGYLLHGRVLRPAMVIVSQAKA
jgi:molecular chaperone GrpE